MPANLPAEAKAKWLKVMEAKTPEEKLRALQEFLAAVPKHKGTEKLIKMIRRKMAILRREIEESRRKKVGRRSSFFIRREGDIQVVIIGCTNSGKSSFLRLLTNAKPEVSEVPFTTKNPVPGMLIHKGVLIQLIEGPAIFEGISHGKAWGPQLMTLIRNSDCLIIILDAKNEPLRQLYTIVRELEESGITIVKPKVQVEIHKERSGGIRVVGQLKECTIDDVRKLMYGYNIHHALIRIKGEATLDDIERALFAPKVYKPAIIVLNKVDSKDDYDQVEKLKSIVRDKVALIALSSFKPKGNEKEIIGELILKTLDLIRVYTKEPGKDPSPRPLVVKRGTKVIDIAKRIHSYLFENFKYAKVWSKYLPYSPQRVGPEYVLRDGDIVEIHA
ncbi:MAG: GTP-binding protein [Thermoprotei archaeon]|nr:MAG: GTP-binding protein [Thermoprotei archaeon]RLF18104.1 MAG: GTP-binding protein [Thermoprotei archaeon]